MKKWKTVFLCLFIIGAAVFFWYLVERDREISVKTLVNSETVPVSNPYTYYMKTQGNSIIVYNKDHSVYEYTDLKLDFLPEEVIQALTSGIYFQNQEELYEFLETYSS